MHCRELHVKTGLFLLDICFCLHICINVAKQSEVKWNSSIMSVSWNDLFLGSTKWRVDATVQRVE